MAIESDRGGADGRLAIKFYKGTFEDPVATQVEGRPMFKEMDCICIQVPGDALNEIDRPVYESDKTRFPIQWANYRNRQDAEGSYEGTPLAEWPLITRSQAEGLRSQRFYTVESIATASDQQLQSVGMLAGMSPYTLRDKARLFIDSAKTAADFTNREQEISTLRQENDKIKAETDAKILAMQKDFDAKLASLLAAVGEKKPKAKKAEVMESAQQEE